MNKPNPIGFIVVLMFIFFGSSIICVDSSANEKDVEGFVMEFDKYIKEVIVPHTPGAALIIVENGKIVSINSYGVREIGTDNPVTPETVFRLASVSKTFASSAVGLLVQNKVTDWNIPVQSQIDYINFKNTDYGKKITLYHILSQSTGLISHAYTNLADDGIPYKKIIDRINEVDFVCSPGECYSYQNVAFSLVGDVIANLTGKSYEVFVTENLFQPLEMKNASFGLTSFIKAENHAVPHVRKNAKWIAAEVTGNYYDLAPAAGVNASITDMGQWLLAQLGYKQSVLSEEILNLVHKKAIKTTLSQAHYGSRENLGNAYYGLGWRIFDYESEKDFVHHGGWVKGFRTEMVLNPRLGIGMAFLTNSETPYIKDVIFKFLEIYLTHKKTSKNDIDYPVNTSKEASLTPE